MGRGWEWIEGTPGKETQLKRSKAFPHLPVWQTYTYVCMYVIFFPTKRPNGGDVPFWGLWTIILEDSLMMAEKKPLLFKPVILLPGICP